MVVGSCSSTATTKALAVTTLCAQMAVGLGDSERPSRPTSGRPTGAGSRLPSAESRGWASSTRTAVGGGGSTATSRVASSGRRMARNSSSVADRDLCITGTDGRLRSLSRNSVYPDWSPDGRHIAFLRPAGDLYRVLAMRADGTAVKQLFPVRVSRYSQWGWSPDGRRLAIEDVSYEKKGDILEFLHRLGVANADGTRFRWVHQQEDALNSSWSPDGRNIAFDCGPDLLGDVCLANVAAGSVRNLTETEDRGEYSGVVVS